MKESQQATRMNEGVSGGNTYELPHIPLISYEFESREATHMKESRMRSPEWDSYEMISYEMSTLRMNERA